MHQAMLSSFVRLQVHTWHLTHHARTERGANLVEYALLLALIVIVCVGAVRTLGAKIPSGFSSATNAL